MLCFDLLGVKILSKLCPVPREVFQSIKRKEMFLERDMKLQRILEKQDNSKFRILISIIDRSNVPMDNSITDNVRISEARIDRSIGSKGNLFRMEISARKIFVTPQERLLRIESIFPRACRNFHELFAFENLLLRGTCLSSSQTTSKSANPSKLAL